ncbi:MAG TPA: carboxyl transferase domain-containing protein, partial [Hyphomicrobiales bacterium]|nr:carboxyl transferase domain-containing protein [Hyphomicrobiales bacterium]
MPILPTCLSLQSEAFKANASHMSALVQRVHSLKEAVAAHSARQADKFRQRGQLLPRERVARLLDRGQHFLELCPLAGWKMHDDDGETRVMGGGAIAGIGVVAGKRAVIAASDSAIKGGTVSPMGLK